MTLKQALIIIQEQRRSRSCKFHSENSPTSQGLVAHLQHPNIIQIYDVGDQDGLPYLLSSGVHEDAEKDVLTGSSGQDWFWCNLDDDNEAARDKITDLNAEEFADDLDFINDDF